MSNHQNEVIEEFKNEMDIDQTAAKIYEYVKENHVIEISESVVERIISQLNNSMKLIDDKDTKLFFIFRTLARVITCFLKTSSDKKEVHISGIKSLAEMITIMINMPHSKDKPE